MDAFDFVQHCVKTADDIRALRLSEQPANTTEGNQKTAFHDPKHETEAEKWDKLSRLRFDGKGWANLAKISLAEDGDADPPKTDLDREEARIDALVTRFREKQSSGKADKKRTR
jgi:hypothetical protein